MAQARVRQRVEPHTWEAFRLTAMEGLSGADAAAAARHAGRHRLQGQEQGAADAPRGDRTPGKGRAGMDDCPSRVRARRIPDRPPAGEGEGRVLAHLESCSACQQALEGLTADPVGDRARSRSAAARPCRPRGLGTGPLPLAVPDRPDYRDPRAGPGRHGCGLPGRAGRAQAAGGPEDDPARRNATRPGRGPLPRRGGGGGPAAAPEHRADPRGRRARRPAVFLRWSTCDGGSLDRQLGGDARRSRGRRPGWSRRWPAPCTTPTSAASSTATSSRPTSCWTDGRRAARRSPTSGWPSALDDGAA